ncbi:hypothetical protein HY213_00210 [Candidatus Peregrinibacteria bacterium]|nr:hypothetical protein [Candidatus Peregrinibacteria bacterium]
MHRSHLFDSFDRLRLFDRYSAFTDVKLLKDFSERPLRKSLRVNTLKTSVDEFKQWAQKRGWMLSPVPWCEEGFFIDRENRDEALGKDLLHLLGHTYMQEAASMLPVSLLDPQPGEAVLDMSAAPGSKTTQIAARMCPPPPTPPPEEEGRMSKNQGQCSNFRQCSQGVIVANDVQEKRLWTLKNALHRCGVINAIVTRKVGQWFAKHMTERFDRVLCDAPCTAQGTSRKDSDALLCCSAENIGKMAKLQRELLESAIHAAKVGGTIVYSTCTLTPEENEEVVLSLLKKFPEQVEVVDPREKWTIDNGQWTMKAIEDSHVVQKFLHSTNKQNYQLSIFNYPFLRLWPHTFDTEGFFCAVLRKNKPTRPVERFDFVRFQEDEVPVARSRELTANLERQYGTSFMREGERLFQRKDQLLLSTQSVAQFGQTTSNYSLGLPFARRLDGDRLRLDHEIAALRGMDATKNFYSLSDSDLDLLLDGKDAACDSSLRGDIILRYEHLAVGIGLAKEGKLKNRLPRWVVVKS